VGGVSAPKQTLKQVWFAGAHADVGGGYKETEAMWSDEALHWMASEATDKGLQLTKNSSSRSFSGHRNPP